MLLLWSHSSDEILTTVEWFNHSQLGVGQMLLTAAQFDNCNSWLLFNKHLVWTKFVNKLIQPATKDKENLFTIP